jgi:ferredoxin/coenzyme F420-reducing hydrogenase delta subunit
MPSGPPPTRQRHLPLIKESAEPPVRGESAFRVADALLQRLDAVVGRVMPPQHNPLVQSGAIATTTFLIATITGIALLFWYQTSVHGAYSSVQAMTESPYGSGFVRTLHRYSSDACMLFVLVHALRLFVARRFGGARWLAWITGSILLLLLWVIGWLGYWLVWDERGELVARGTARMLDVLPVFADPLSRSFLVDAKVNSLLFFVVFFVHMLVPLALAVVLWIHIKRLSRPQFWTKVVLTSWTTFGLSILSLVVPADLAPRAQMAITSNHQSFDAFYLLPLVLTERLSGGVLWTLFLLGGAVMFSLPFVLARKRAQPALVVEARCNACRKCYSDCPYDAISMQPRTDGKDFDARAFVNADLCVGCGICAGSCDSAGVGVDWYGSFDIRTQLDDAIKHRPGVPVAFLCAEGIGTHVAIDAEASCSELEGFVTLRVPCAGWIHPLIIERAMRRGATGALIATCGSGSCRYREGAEWTLQRFAGKREPILRTEKVDPKDVEVAELFPRDKAGLQHAAQRLAQKSAAPPPTLAPLWMRAAFGLAAMAFVLVLTWAGNLVSHPLPDGIRSSVVVSFKHAGQLAEACVEPTADELANLPKHMRPQKKCERRRSDVRLRVSVDGNVVHSEAISPGGIWKDSASLAVVRVPVSTGPREILIEVGDGPEPNEYGFSTSKRIDAKPGHDVVVLFDDSGKFEWHQ